MASDHGSSSGPSSSSSSGSSTATTTSVKLHLKPSPSSSDSNSIPPSSENPLPPLIQTPTGLAILELQGTFNTADSEEEDDDDPDSETSGKIPVTELGHITFPDYRPDDGIGNTNTGWMKKVYMFIGQHQRLAGEVKKLPKPLGVVRRRRRKLESEEHEEGDEEEEDLEILEVVRYKLVFSSRPEPVTTSTEGEAMVS